MLNSITQSLRNKRSKKFHKKKRSKKFKNKVKRKIKPGSRSKKRSIEEESKNDIEHPIRSISPMVKLRGRIRFEGFSSISEHLNDSNDLEIFALRNANNEVHRSRKSSRLGVILEQEFSESADDSIVLRSHNNNDIFSITPNNQIQKYAKFGR